MDHYESTQDKNSFLKNGFSIVRGVLSKAEVQDTRKYLDDCFKKEFKSPTRLMLIDSLLKHKQLYELFFKPKIVDSLRGALGQDLAYMNDFSIHRNHFGIDWPQNSNSPKRGDGWHVDCGSEDYNPYLREKNYRFAKCGIFLQNYNNGFGGGIYVKPASHKYYLKNSLIHKLLRLNFRMYVRLLKAGIIKEFSPQVYAGDLIFFDSRLFHASARPYKQNLSLIGTRSGPLWTLPDEHTKYALYWNACNEKMVNDFLMNNFERAKNEKKRTVTEGIGYESVFTTSLSMRFPESYPEDFVNIVSDRNIQIPTLPQSHYKSLFEVI